MLNIECQVAFAPHFITSLYLTVLPYVAVRAVNLKEQFHQVAEIELSKSYLISLAIIISNIAKGSYTASKFRKIRYF
jgi:hypothetical protein